MNKKIKRLSELPEEQRLKIMSILNRNRYKAPTPTAKKRTQVKKKFTSVIGKNDYQNWILKQLN
jgi:hypothetical protein